MIDEAKKMKSQVRKQIVSLIDGAVSVLMPGDIDEFVQVMTVVVFKFVSDKLKEDNDDL